MLVELATRLIPNRATNDLRKARDVLIGSIGVENIGINIGGCKRAVLREPVLRERIFINLPYCRGKKVSYTGHYPRRIYTIKRSLSPFSSPFAARKHTREHAA